MTIRYLLQILGIECSVEYQCFFQELRRLNYSVPMEDQEGGNLQTLYSPKLNRLQM